MNIEKLHISNFGPFQEEEILFKSNCVNLILGDSDSGKTQLVGSLLYLVNGGGILQIDEECHNTNSLVEAIISETHLKHKISRIMKDSKLYFGYSNNVQTMKSLRNIDFNNTNCINFNPFVFFAENMVSKEINIDVSRIGIIEEMLTGNERALVYWKKLSQVFKTSNNIKRDIFTHSYGVQSLMALISFILDFLRSEQNQPIIFDSITGGLDFNAKFFILSILDKMAKKNQVIVLDYTESHNIKELNQFSVEIIKKLSSNKPIRNRISYKYGSKHLIFPLIDRNVEKTKIVFQYVKDSILGKEENRYIEFKEVKGNNPISSILSLVDQYVVAFLNDNKSQQGQIIWGITDIHSKIVGVELDLGQRDKLRREIPEKLSKILPFIPQSSYEINIKNVVDVDNNELEDLFVVEVVINAVKSDFLYSTANGEIYIKTDGGKKKLSVLEVQKELLFRNGFRIKNN